MSFPCSYCNVRPDIACRHRPADPEWRHSTPPPEPEKIDGRKLGRGQGHNFRRGKSKYAR